MQLRSRRMLLGMSLVLEGGLLAVAHLLGLVFDVPPWGTLRFEARALLLGCLATLPPVLFFFFSLRTAWAPLRQLSSQVQAVAESLFIAASALDLAFVSFLAGVCEETFFRGFLHAWVAREWNPSMALVVTSALFAMAHPVSRLYAGIAAGISLYLGGLFLASQNLLVPMVVHGLYDFVALATWCRRVREARGNALKPGAGAALGPDPAASLRRGDDGER